MPHLVTLLDRDSVPCGTFGLLVGDLLDVGGEVSLVLLNLVDGVTKDQG